MSALRVLIVDDEPLARRKLRRLVEAESGFACAGECPSGEEALERLGAERFDAMFLDVQMPGLSGFDVVERAPAERLPPIVFVTAFDRYAVKAFEIAAVDYLLKPFDRERFQRALQRLRERAEAPGKRVASDELRALLDALGDRDSADRFLAKKGDGFVTVRAADVAWIEAQGNYVALHTGAESLLLRDTLSGLERRLDPRRFARAQRSAIVNLDQVAALRPWQTGSAARLAADRHSFDLSLASFSFRNARMSSAIASSFVHCSL
jgi:two-component system, LytTR family, response regulator